MLLDTQKMKQLRSFVKKEFFHILRDKRTLVILFGMPIVQIILFGFAITNEISNAKIAILDQSKDQATQEITQRLLSSGYFELDGYLNTQEEIEQQFKKGRIKFAVVFGPDFGNHYAAGETPQVQVLADATDPNTATTLVAYAASIIRDYAGEGVDINSVPYGINVETKMLYNPEMKAVYMFVPGVMTIILMLVSTMMTSIAITREKELGTMEVLLASPLHPWLIIISKVIPYMVLSIINCTVVICLGKFVFGMPIAGSLFLLAFVCIIFIMTALSLGILISTVAPTQQVAMMMSLMGLMLPTILLSGFIFPIENMPLPLQIISNIVPAKWFIIIVKDVMIKGSGIQYIIKEISVMLLMVAVLLGLSLRNYKVRLA